MISGTAWIYIAIAWILTGFIIFFGLYTYWYRIGSFILSKLSYQDMDKIAGSCSSAVQADKMVRSCREYELDELSGLLRQRLT